MQLINSNFLHLRPGKIKYFFDHLRRQNGSMFLTLAGNDYYFVKPAPTQGCFAFQSSRLATSLPNCSTATRPICMDGSQTPIADGAEYLYENIDGAMAILPNMTWPPAKCLATGSNSPTSLLTSQASLLPSDNRRPLRLFIGMRGGIKSKRHRQNACRMQRPEREMPGRWKWNACANLSLSEYLQRMKNSHIVLDQFYSYSLPQTPCRLWPSAKWRLRRPAGVLRMYRQPREVASRILPVAS